MPKKRVIAYVDGFNFYFRRLRNKPYRWLNLVALFDALFPHDEVIAVKYFTARVSGKFDASKPIRQDIYLRALKTLPRLEVIEGQYLIKQTKRRLVEPHVNLQGNTVNAVLVWDSDEKGSDVNLGTHLLNDAWKNTFDVAAVLTNDSDLAGPMEMVLRQNKTIVLFHPDNNASKKLMQCASNALHIHDKYLNSSQFPPQVRLHHGGFVSKPTGF